MSRACQRPLSTTVLLWLLLLWSIMPPGTLRGAESAGTAQNFAPSDQSLVLEYTEVGYSMINCGAHVTPLSPPYDKEPDLGRSKLLRGSLQFGTNTSNTIPFLWDNTQAKLYLDLNRNRNLTDDPEGVYAADQRRVSSRRQIFTNVHLPFQTSSGRRRYLVDLNLYSTGSHVVPNVMLRSFWQGKLTSLGQDWQVGLVEDFESTMDAAASGYLLLRPWKERNDSFTVQNGVLVGARFQRNLFFHNQAYAIGCAFESQGDAPKCKLTFHAQQPRLGELNLTGTVIDRLVLQGEPYAVILDSPASVVKVPVGNYSQLHVQLRQGQNIACTTRRGTKDMISVAEHQPAVLEEGGPLTNSVAIRRRGKHLNLDYKLVGRGSRGYEMERRELATLAPEFTITQAGRVVASGKFEFG